jgi:mono/diheme cytochrome c family protein
MIPSSDERPGTNRNAKGLVVGSLILSLIALVIAEAVITEATSAQRRSPRSRAAAALKADELFRRDCARCHGADGRGDTPLGHMYNAPDFTDPEWWLNHAQITGTKTLVSIVTRGKGNMPAFGKKLTRSEINLLVSHVRRFRSQSNPVRLQ